MPTYRSAVDSHWRTLVFMPIDVLPTFTGGCTTSIRALKNSTTAPCQTTAATLATQFKNKGAYVPAYNAAGFNQSFIVGFVPLGASTYHGLQAQLQHRMANGLYFQGAYTFSHLIDNSTADSFSTVIAPHRPHDFRNLPPALRNSVLAHR